MLIIRKLEMSKKTINELQKISTYNIYSLYNKKEKREKTCYFYIFY